MWNGWSAVFEIRMCDGVCGGGQVRNGANCQRPMDSRDCCNSNSCGLGGRAADMASLRALSMAQGGPCHGRDFLDGRNAVPSASLRVSLWSGNRLAPIRDVQSDG